MAINSPICPRSDKTGKQWRSYIKGASALLAEFACTGSVVTVLTRPPPNTYSSRPRSTYQFIEEPILKGLCGRPCASQIVYIHPTVVGAEDYSYQAWPIDDSRSWVELYGNNPSERRRWRCTSSAPSHTQRSNQGLQKFGREDKSKTDAITQEQKEDRTTAKEKKGYPQETAKKEATKTGKKKAKKVKERANEAKQKAERW